MNVIREAAVARISSDEVDLSHPYYLHYRRLFSDLLKVSIHAHGRLLDIGCGNKPYQGMFAGKVREHVGCDIVQSSLQQVDIICPATDIPVEDATFDTVLCTQVIEHVAEHRLLLSEAFRVLRKNGTLLLSGPMYWPLHEEPYDFFRFTQHGLRHLLHEAGFNEEAIIPNGGKWALCGQAIQHAIRNTPFHRRLVIKLLNKCFAYLDDRYPCYENPMNYVVVARKLSP